MKSTRDSARRWLLFLYSLPAAQASQRVTLWRRIRKSGALPLKTSAYVLPDEPAHFERFHWLAQQVQDDGGEATLARVSQIEGVSHEALVHSFNDAREEDYRPIVDALRKLLETHRRKRGDGLTANLEKLRRQVAEVRTIDFFDSKAGRQAEILLEQGQRLTSPRSRKPAVLEAKSFHRRLWLTRPHPEIDRVGSAWLIRRFIDPHARFVFASAPTEHPEAVPYDMLHVEFTHHDDDCTFETLLKRFGIDEPALAAIGEMIHDADLEDGKYQRPECAGLDLLLKGWHQLGLNDAELLERGFSCFDALYCATGGKRPHPPRSRRRS